jgi:uncharacterized small protein (DUF1192 family)
VKERLGVLQREIHFRESEISKLNSEIGRKQAEASSATVSSQLQTIKKAELEQALSHKDLTIKRLQAELDDTKR